MHYVGCSQRWIQQDRNKSGSAAVSEAGVSGIIGYDVMIFFLWMINFICEESHEGVTAERENVV